MNTSTLVFIDGLFAPVYWLATRLTNTLGRERKKTTRIIAIKFFGLGSLVRMAYVLKNSDFNLNNFTLITLSKNRQIVEELGLNAIFIRPSISAFFTAVFECWGAENTRIVDLERSSNIAGIFRVICSLGKSNSSFSFNKRSVKLGRQLLVTLHNKSALNGLYEVFEINKKKIEAAKSSLNNEVILVNINAGEYLPERKYALENFHHVIKNLHAADSTIQLVLTGSANEREYVNRLEKKLNNSSIKVRNEVGRQSISELVEEIKHCKLLITNDSGPLHLANYYRVPTFAIWGPTSSKLVGYADSVIMKNAFLEMRCSPCFKHPKSKVAESCEGEITCLKNLKPDLIAGQIMEFMSNLEKKEVHVA